MTRFFYFFCFFLFFGPGLAHAAVSFEPSSLPPNSMQILGLSSAFSLSCFVLSLKFAFNALVHFQTRSNSSHSTFSASFQSGIFIFFWASLSLFFFTLPATLSTIEHFFLAGSRIDYLKDMASFVQNASFISFY